MLVLSESLVEMIRGELTSSIIEPKILTEPLERCSTRHSLNSRLSGVPTNLVQEWWGSDDAPVFIGRIL
jgi:hypothetical protein